MENVAKLKDDKGDIWIFESSKNQKITLVKLGEECFGSIDALRQVETSDVIDSQSRVVVFPGDLVFLKKDLDLGPLLRLDTDSACTALLVDVGEVDEHGVPLKESSKVSNDHSTVKEDGH